MEIIQTSSFILLSANHRGTDVFTTTIYSEVARTIVIKGYGCTYQGYPFKSDIIDIVMGINGSSL